MAGERLYSNKEVAAYIRAYVKNDHSIWSWPTDGLDYEQHVRFVRFRNRFWPGGTAEEFKRFCLKYADKLEQTPGRNEVSY